MEQKICNYFHKHYAMINLVIFVVWAIALAVYSAYSIKGGI